jgi:hypothetical protein
MQFCTQCQIGYLWYSDSGVVGDCLDAAVVVLGREYLKSSLGFLAGVAQLKSESEAVETCVTVAESPGAAESVDALMLRSNEYDEKNFPASEITSSAIQNKAIQ